MAPKKKKAPPTVIPGSSFNNPAELSDEVLKKLVVSNPADTSNLISDWQGGLGCGMYIQLSNDNLKIEACSPILLGDVFPISPTGQRKVISLNAAWANFPSLALALNPIDGSLFKFEQNMVSELVDSNTLDFDLLSGSVALSEEECIEGGIRGFTFRAYLQPTTHEYVKLLITLYPIPLADLTASHPLCTDPHFPALKVWAGMIPLLPQAKSIIAEPWGFPILPSLLQGGPANNFPSSAALRGAMSATLRTASKPEVKAGFQTLLPRWNAILQSGEEALVNATPDLIWPAMGTSPAENSGRPKLPYIYLRRSWI